MLALLAASLFAAPCGAGELLVGAATSLRGPVEASARAFETAHPDTKLRLAYSASDVLAAQVRAGAPLDVLLSADDAVTARLEKVGLCEKPRLLARNRIVVLGRSGIPPLHSAWELAAAPILQIAVPEVGVPVGRYAREWLKARGILEFVKIGIVPTEHARATLVAIDNGSVDAAIVYTTDARLAKLARVIWEIPEAEQPQILYTAAVLRGSREARAARLFVAFLIDGPGRADLERAGFAPPP